MNMENIKENLEMPLQNFIEEIRKLKETEQAEKKSISLLSIEPDELTIEDAECWAKIADGSITGEDLNDYREKLLDKDGHPKEGVSKSRIAFFAFINNRASIIFLQK